MKSSPSIQPHATTQALQPAAAAPAGVVTPVRTSMMSWFHWYHAVGFLAASGAGTAVLIKVIITSVLNSL